MKAKSVPVHAVKANGGGMCGSPQLFNTDTRW